MYKIVSVPLLLLFSLHAISQTTLTLQPDSAAGKDAIIVLESTWAGQYGDDSNFIINAWTISGDPITYRSLIEFDLSSIPATAIIDSAKLYLYCFTASNHAQLHSYYPGSPYPSSNPATLRRITSSWDEHMVTWATQPTTTDVNMVAVPASTSKTEDYTIDVTTLVQDMVTYPAASFGFMMRLNTEATYRSMVFASSDNTNASKHPKLVAYYHDPASVSDINTPGGLKVFPNPATGSVQIFLPPGLKGLVALSITDINGKIVEQQIINANGQPVTIPVSGYAKGFYVVHASSGNWNALGKISVQ